jgi:hypothetical protein
MALYELDESAAEGLEAPLLVAAFDGWVDAGGAATTALARMAEDGGIVAAFDGDALLDFRARRPTLEIVDGRPDTLSWPSLSLRRSPTAGTNLLVLTGAEPDFRWNQLAGEIVELAQRLGVSTWISVGSIPAAVPHTRPVPILGTQSAPGLLRGDVQAGPAGTLRVPAAFLSVLDHSVARAGIPAVGYFAQVPHYVTGAYPAASLALLTAVERHVGTTLSPGALTAEAVSLRSRLDRAAASDADTRAHVERLEAMVDEARLPEGDELIGEIERFLRDRSGGSGPERPN